MKLTKTVAAALLAAGMAAYASAGAADSTEFVMMQSYEEVPAISSGATGSFWATVDERNHSIFYWLRYDGLEGDVRQAHIHLGQRGVAGGISVFLCQTSFNPDPSGLAPECPQSGLVTGMITSANIVGPGVQGIAVGEIDELIAAIRAGVAYPNVHSTKFPSGEIRGQLRGH